MDIITVGNANAQEAVLAINVLMSVDSAEDSASYSAFAKIYLFAMYISSNFMAECCQHTKAT